MNTPATHRAARAGKPPRTRAAVAAAAGFIAIAGFEIALALGAPVGRAAWGGAHVYLTEGLRIASVFAAAFWALAALVILARAGFRGTPVPFRASLWGAWVLTGVLALGALMNFASPSAWERFLQAPIALAMAVLCLIVARGGHQRPGPIPDRPAA